MLTTSVEYINARREQRASPRLPRDAKMTALRHRAEAFKSRLNVYRHKRARRREDREEALEPRHLQAQHSISRGDAYAFLAFDALFMPRC